MGNILYGDLGSEHMIYAADSQIEPLVRTLYASCSTLMAGYYHSNNKGLWCYVYKYNARHGGYLSGFSSEDVQYPSSNFDKLTFSDRSEFEEENHVGSLVIRTEKKCKIDKNTSIAIIKQLFEGLKEKKTVYLTMSKSNESMVDYVQHGLELCHTILSTFPKDIQKYITFLSNAIPNKENTLRINLMILPPDYKEVYLKECHRSFQYKVIDCDADNRNNQSASPYMNYLSARICDEVEMVEYYERAFEHVNNQRIESSGVQMEIYDDLFSLLYYNLPSNFDTKKIRIYWKKIYINKSFYDLNEIKASLNAETLEVLNEDETNSNNGTNLKTKQSDNENIKLPDDIKYYLNGVLLNKTEPLLQEQSSTNSIIKAKRNMSGYSPKISGKKLSIPNNRKESSSKKGIFPVREASNNLNHSSQDNSPQLDSDTKQGIIQTPESTPSYGLNNITKFIQDYWLEIISVFSSTIKRNYSMANESMLVFESLQLFLPHFYPTSDKPGNDVVAIELEYGIYQTAYHDFESHKFISKGELAEYFAMGLFIRYAFFSWIRKQSIGIIQVQQNKREICKVSVNEASYLFFSAIIMFYEELSKSTNNPVYTKIYNSILDELGKYKGLFNQNSLNTFIKSDNSNDRQVFWTVITVGLCGLILQLGMNDEDTISLKAKKERDNSRKILAEYCKLSEYINKVQELISEDYINRRIFNAALDVHKLISYLKS